MTAPHFFVEDLTGVAAGDTVTLSGPDSRHALRALRLRPGEPVTVADGAGWFVRGALVGEKDGGLAAIEAFEVESLSVPSPAVTVAMAPPKGDRLAWAVQKLAEIGVDVLLLLRGSDRAVRRASADREATQRERLQRIAREAAMQSRRPFVMDVGFSALDDVLLSDTPIEAVLLLWEGATLPLGQALPGPSDPMPGAVRLVVGPEGGFSEAELDLAASAGAQPVSLGGGILRTETAALVSAAVTLSAFGRLG